MGLISGMLGGLKTHATNSIVNPAMEIIDTNLADITTTIGSFIVRSIRGKFQRSITFNIGSEMSDQWMEEALYGILYEYNKVKLASNLELSNKKGFNDGSTMYYKLGDGTHNLKYKKWNILLCIQSTNVAVTQSRSNRNRTYTIITFDLDPNFVTSFERDMVMHRNSLLRIKKDSPFLTIYRDYHESDGWTTWEKAAMIPKRRLNTIYIPEEQKKLLVTTINNFFASKKFYNEHGIPHNLKILLHGDAGTGKSSITKMIASEWNRNLFECSGGKNGRYMANAITANYDFMTSPLMSISDIDKYPQLVNEPDVNLDEKEGKEEKLAMKQAFNNMINALDGITSPEDRIIVMTTNHIEKFSPTILRPGRIDLIMEIGYTTPEVFRKYVFDMYGKELPTDIVLKDKELTISKMQFDVVFAKLSFEDFVKKYVE